MTVNVSDVPLLNLDFVKRNPILNAGENTELVVLGDFADQKGVVLPDSYLTYTSINPEVAPIDAAGKVTGLTKGTSILSASRNNLQAVTPIRIGTMPQPTTDAQLHQILAEMYGLDPYPDAVSLTPGATRKLSLGLNSNFTEANLTAASTGTRYFSNNSNILNVSPDGTITAVGIGDGTVTAIHGTASATIPVRVEAPKIGTTALGTDGGIVNSNDGTLAVMIPPGALEQNATVSIAPVNQQNLSLPLPPGFEFAGAFNLNFGDNSLNIPAQLAVPAPAGLAPGTVAYFLRKGAIPDATGTWNPIWLQEESGIVGDDGNIRTQSPPYPGVVRPGEYAVVYASPTGSATLVKGQLTLNYNFPLAFFGIIDPQGNIGQLIEPDKFVTSPAFTVTRDISSVQVVAIPKVGLPVVTEVGVQRNDDGTATFKAALNMPAPTSSDPTIPPVLQKAELKFKDENNQQFENNEPLLFLTGGNILVNNASDSKGSRFEDLVVKFQVGNRVYEGTVLPNRSRSVGGNQFEVAVQVPNTLPLGASGIVLTRKQNQLVEQNGTAPVYKPIEYNSNPIRLPQGAEYVFAALGSADRVVVLDGTDPESVVAATRSSDLLLSSIPVGTNGVTDWAEATAVTGDGTRVYVALRESGRVALVDPMVLRQVDTTPDTEDVNSIALPAGARPGAIAIDPKDNYAYIADRNRGNVYVLDIDPFSPTYHQVVQTIAIGPAGPRTLRQMAISNDGRKLFVAAVGDGIYAINIDPKDRPSNSNPNDRKWHQQIGAIPMLRGAFGMTPTSNPSLIAFTSGNTGVDAQGYGVLKVTNDDPINFSATVRYAPPLLLGSEQDYFDLNEAVSVTITRDGRYAFVAGRNSGSLRPFTDVRLGGNIGIISDPLGPNPQLVAATRPIPDALTNDLVLSNDNKFLYASYPSNEGRGVYVFDVEEMTRTLENPGQFQIDSLDRGTGSGFFTTGRAVTNADFARVPIDDINPAISIAADYSIIAENRPANQFTYGVPSGSVRGPLGIDGSLRDLSAAPTDWLNLLSSGANTNDLTPTLNWKFEPGWKDVEEVNLFVSTFDKDKGLLPWDKVVNLSDSTLLPGLSATQKREFLSKPWGDHNDFNPNRILTATWKKETDSWYWHDRTTPIAQPVNGSPNTKTTFTLPKSHTLTAGQTYYWGINAISGGEQLTDTKPFQTFLPLNNDKIFKSVTVFTHGFENQESLQPVQYERAFSVAKAGASNPDDPGTVMRYNGKTGEWQAVDEQGRIRENVTAKSALGKPLVLLVDWATGGESVIPDSGFSEGAADAIFASLVKLDRDVDNKLFESPMHLIGHSRGTIVTSEIVQRFGTYFGDKIGKNSPSGNDLHVTYLDAHDFKQKLPIGRYNTFYEPSVQVWDNVNFADNYFQEVPEPNHPLGLATPIGRNIPFAAPFPADLPINPETRLGEPDLSIRLGAYRDSNDSNTNPRNIGSNPSTAGNYSQNFAGFIKDSLVDPPGPHARVNWWYNGTTDLSLTDYPPDNPAPSIYRRLSDGSYERLFDRDFYNRYQTLNPWYQPDHTAAAFSFADPNAPWEGIGTGWFYSTLGGGKDLRPHTSNPRVPVDFDNTFAERMRGHAAVPSIFNGNFDAVTKPRDRFTPYMKQLPKWPYDLPGWSFHNGSEERSYDSLYLEIVNPSATPDLYNYALTMGKPLVGDQIGAPTFLPALTEINHNRLYVPQDTANLQLDLKVTKASADDVLQVYMTYFDDEQGENVGSAFEGFKLDEVTVAGFKSLKLKDDPFESFKAPGNTATLRFKLVDTNNDGLSAELLLDNIRFLKA